MATREELIAALRRADAAGDVPAAQAIARRLDSMRREDMVADRSNPGAISPGVLAGGREMESPVADQIAAGTARQQRLAEEIARSRREHTPVEESGFENFRAGVGKAFVDTYRGAQQVGAEIADAVLPGDPGFSEEMQAKIDRSSDADRALMDTGAGFAGNVLGHAATLIGPGVLAKGGASMAAAANAPRAAAALNTAGNALLPRTLAGNVAQGAALGAIQPVETGGSRLGNAGMGAGAGAVGYAIPGLARGAKAALIDPLTDKGQERIIANTLGRFASDIDNVRNPATPGLPGYQPTLAEATLDPGIARLQRTVHDGSIAASNLLDNVGRQNNAARVTALRGIAGDDASRASAEAVREKAAIPLLNQAKGVTGVSVKRTSQLIDRILAGEAGERDTIRVALRNVQEKLYEPYDDAMRTRDAHKIVADAINAAPRISSSDRAILLEARRALANRGQQSAEELLAGLKGLKPRSITGRRVIAGARDLLAAPNVRGKEDVARLYGVRKHIDDLMAGRVAGDNAAASAARRELQIIKRSLDRAITRQSPEFGRYLRTYTEMSRPINQMEVGEELMRRSVGGNDPVTGLPIVQAGQFQRNVRNLDQIAQKGTGFKRARADVILDPAQMEAINQVNDSLQRKQFAENAGRATGSNTFQNLASQNVMSQLGVPDALANIGPLGSVTRTLDTVYKVAGVPDRLQARLAEVLANPQQAQTILRKLPRPDREILIRALASQAVRAAELSAE